MIVDEALAAVDKTEGRWAEAELYLLVPRAASSASCLRRTASGKLLSSVPGCGPPPAGEIAGAARGDSLEPALAQSEEEIRSTPATDRAL